MSSIFDLEFSVSLLVIITNTILCVVYDIFCASVIGSLWFQMHRHEFVPQNQHGQAWAQRPRDIRCRRVFSSRMTKRRILDTGHDAVRLGDLW